MAGDLTRKAIAVQPEWLSQVPTGRRLPEGRIAVVGCGTSFHAAQTSGNGYDALEFVLHPPEADVLVLVSHEGTTPLTIEAAEAFAGPKWLVTAKAESRLAALVRRGRHRDSRGRGELLPHRELHVGRRNPRRASGGGRLVASRRRLGRARRRAAAGLGTRPLAACRRGARLADRPGGCVEAARGRVSALPRRTSWRSFCTGTSRPIDENVRCFVLEGEGRAVARAAETVAALA